jgi:DNA-directed RNA polymerase specialized sigma24 family protein
MNRSDLSQLDRMTSRLPFPISDGRRVAQLFGRYRRWRREADRELLEIWIYCYVRRYFLVRFARDSKLGESEFEAAIERAYRSITRGREGIRDPELFPHWVSVICRNTFVNLVARTRPMLPVDRVAEPVSADTPSGQVLDRIVLFEALAGAIDRLPGFLQPVARMHLIEQLDYTVISERTGRSLPTVRSYMHKAARRMRKDPLLCRVVGLRPENDNGT